MKRIEINPILYFHYLLSSFDNHIGSHLAEIIECSHDAISDFLSGSPLKPRHFWESVKGHLPLKRLRREALIFDDTVLDKNFSKKIEGTARQWSSE